MLSKRIEYRTMSNTAKPISVVGISLRNLRRQRLRTVLTVGGVAMGVVAIVAFGGVVRGMWAASDKALHANEADISIFQAGIAIDLFSSVDEDAVRVAALADPDVEGVFGVLTHIMPVGNQRFMIVFGVDREELKRDDKLVRGRVVADSDEMTIGVRAEALLERSVGDTVDVAGRTFKIVGVFDSGVVFFDGAVVMRLDVLQSILSRPGQATNMQVRCRESVDPSTVADRLEKTIPGIVAICDVADYHRVDQGLEVLSSMVWIVSVLALVIGSIIVTNTMWMSVQERTREIGVLRAVGWSRSRVMGMVVAEAVAVGALAGVLGSVAGVGLAAGLTLMPRVAQVISPVYEADVFLAAFAVALLMSVFGAALPSWRAGQISPVEALRYE
jgi:putative ABC transport system permease protein